MIASINPNIIVWPIVAFVLNATLPSALNYFFDRKSRKE
jgi:hypothetical protein